MPRKKVTKPIPEVEEIKEHIEQATEVVDSPEIGSVIYEQDFRATAHSNGRAVDLVGGEINDPPKEPPEEGEPFHDKGSGGQSNTLQYILAGTYLAAGGIAIWIGITMIRDLRGKKNG